MSAEKLYSGTSLADKIILALDKMRYSDKCGDPKGFTTFLLKNHLPKGLWVRCRGNRRHVKMRNAEACVKYRGQITEYLKSHCQRDTAFRSAIGEAFQMEIVHAEFEALSVFSQMLSKAWMTHLYVDHANKMTHMGAFQIVKQVIQRMEALITNEEPLSEPITGDLFGRPFDTALCTTSEITQKMLLTMFRSAYKDLQHQYKSYLAKTPEELVVMDRTTKSSAVHNIYAEEVVGMVSAAQHKAPGASMIFLGSVIKSIKNKTVQHLEQLEEDLRNKRIALVWRL